MTNDRSARLASWRGVLFPAVVLAAIYVVWAPRTADLAAQTARAELFDRSGFVPFWTGWYAGIPTTSYSLTTPPLLGWFGPVWLGALAIVGTALAIVPLLRDARRPRAGAAFFVIAATLDVVSGRATFAVGVVVALAALLAAERRRGLTALLLAAIATATSPVAGFLLLVVAAAMVLASSGRRGPAFGVGVGVVAALGVIAWLSQGADHGYEPLTRTSLLMAVGTSLVVVLSPVGRRVRAAGVVTILMLVIVFFIHSPIGANATRIAVLAAAPTIVAASRSRVLMLPAVVVASLLPFAQLHNDLSASGADDSSRAFVAPLVSQLTDNPVINGHRVEVVDTATHWPSTYLLPTVALARGWERQVDETRNPLFYGRAPLTAATYRGFLDRNAVSAVAVAQGVPLDYGSKTEAALIAGGLPYLHQVWSNAHWRLYTVADPTSIVPAPLVADRLTDTGVSFIATGPGSAEIRLRWSPYLVVDGGVVSRAPDGNTRVRLTRAGPHLLHAVWRWP